MNEDSEKPKNETEVTKRPCGNEHPCGGCSNDTSGEDGDDVGRSQFIRAAFAGVTVCWGGMTLLPFLAYLNPPAGEDDKNAKVTSIEVCKLADIPKGTGKKFRFGSFPALLIHTDDGELHAFNATCTHLGCTVQYRPDKLCIYCACHGGQYDAHTGKNIAGPPPKPLALLKVKAVDGNVIVYG